MITQELIDYIKLQKKQRVSDETIKNNLLKSNWSEQDISTALSQVNTSQPIQFQTPTPAPALSSSPSQQAQVYAQQAGSSLTPKKEKPKIFKIFSALFLFIAFLYGLATVMIIAAILLINKSETDMGVPDFDFLKYFPSIEFIPLFILLATILFIFVGLKIADGSRKSWWLGVSSLIIVPIMLYLILLNSSGLTQLVMIAAGEKENIIKPSFSLQNLGRFIYSLPSFGFILLPLLAFFKNFHFENQTLSKKSKIFLTIVIIIFALPIVSVIGYSHYKSADTDYGYTKAKSEVNYHVYKPEFIPGGRTNRTVFIPYQELAGLQNAIEVAYATPLDKALQGENLPLIVMRQVGVNPEFDLKSFSSGLIKDPTSIEQISLSLAANQNAYLIQKADEPGLKSLAFITKDNVLIIITTLKATKEELIQLAESLR